MILMTQKKSVTSGTLLSIVRPSESAGRRGAVLVMGRSVGIPTLRLPDCRDRGQLEHQPAARAGPGGHVAAAGARQPAGQRQAEAGAVAAGAPHAGLERLLDEVGREAWPVVADRQPDAAVGARELERDVLPGVPAGVLQ